MDEILSLSAPPQSSLPYLLFFPRWIILYHFIFFQGSSSRGPLICFDESAKMTSEERKEMIVEAIHIDGAKTSGDLWPCQGVPMGFSLSHYRSTPSLT